MTLVLHQREISRFRRVGGHEHARERGEHEDERWQREPLDIALRELT